MYLCTGAETLCQRTVPNSPTFASKTRNAQHATEEERERESASTGELERSSNDNRTWEGVVVVIYADAAVRKKGRGWKAN